jgi:hypothetical protein
MIYQLSKMLLKIINEKLAIVLSFARLKRVIFSGPTNHCTVTELVRSGKRVRARKSMVERFAVDRGGTRSD